MRNFTPLFAIASLAGCNLLGPSGPVFFETPPGFDPISSPGPSPSGLATTATASRRPIALARPIEPKESLLATPLEVTLVAGGTYGSKDGSGADAQFAVPGNLTLDLAGNLIVVEAGSNVLRRVTPDGVVTTLSGADGKRLEFKKPVAAAMDRSGILYVAEGILSNRILKLPPAGAPQLLAGDGKNGFKNGRGEEARFSYITSLSVSDDGIVFVGEYAGRIRRIALDGDTTTYAGSGGVSFSKLEAERALEAAITIPSAVAFDRTGGLLVGTATNPPIRRVTPDGQLVKTIISGSGFVDGRSPHSKVGSPAQFSIGKDATIYFADSRNHAIRHLTSDGVVTTLVGDGFDGKLLGKNDRARIHSPRGVAVTPDGTLYIADSGNNRIVRVQSPM